MKVIVILMRDVRIEGVEAVVAIPEGKTAEEAYQGWLAKLAAEMVADEGEEPDQGDLSESYPYEEMTIQ